MANANAATLWWDACWPRQGVVKEVLTVIGGSLVVALAAQVALPLPFSPVPVTCQTFAVLFLGAALGARRSALALVLYLTEGAAGLPVFAPWSAVGLGVVRLLGPTAGYLIAFPLAAFMLGWFAERGWSRSAWRLGIAMLVAEVIIFGGGVSWLRTSLDVSLGSALRLGLYPFLPGEVLKCLLAALALPVTWRFLPGSNVAPRA